MKLLVALLLSFGAQDDADWTALWARVQALEERGAEAPAVEWSALRRDAESARRAVDADVDASAAERFRVALLARVLARHDGLPAPALDDGAVPARFLPGEAFLAARHLDPGLERARAFAAALEEPLEEAAAFPILSAAYEAFVADEAAWRAEAARAIAAALHARAQATWSAFCLEGIARRQGDHDVADAALADQIARTEPGAERTDLVLRRALAAAGAGRTELFRDLLGQGLVAGATDAYQMLGLEALSTGRRARARRLFGVLVERDRLHGEERAPWALRGWGASQLPAPIRAPLQEPGKGR